MIHLLNVMVVSIFNISPLQPVPHELHAHPLVVVSDFAQISQVDREKMKKMKWLRRACVCHRDFPL
jgi:hypothetical protein